MKKMLFFILILIGIIWFDSGDSIVTAGSFYDVSCSFIEENNNDEDNVTFLNLPVTSAPVCDDFQVSLPYNVPNHSYSVWKPPVNS